MTTQKTTKASTRRQKTAPATQRGSRSRSPQPGAQPAHSIIAPPELIVIVKPEARVRALPEGVASARGGNARGLDTILRANNAQLRPLFGLSEDRLQIQTRALSPAEDGQPTPDLSLYYRVQAPKSKLRRLASALRKDPSVEAAYLKPESEAPIAFEIKAKQIRQTRDAAPAVTPDFRARQGYLRSAPAGIDAEYAWSLPGGRGAGIRVIDCEWGWLFTHEDLSQNQGGVIAGTGNTTDTNHGTAVLGVISGDQNALGIIGIASDATISASSFVNQSSSTAIKAAADKLKKGDIILLEIHRAGPRAPNPPQGQRGYIAIEWWPDDFAAIRYAVQKGIVVVEAAGNGSENLDDPAYDTAAAGFPSTWRNPFNLRNPSSGAVIIGAAAPPPNTHGRNHGPDRSRLDFSNFGARVDAQGWGVEVTSTGYGDLQNSANADLRYTDQFNGTSSASPIVVGALTCVQGVLRSRGRRLLNAQDARRLLRSSGSPQQDAPSRPATQRIGFRPNLRQLIARATRQTRRSADFNGDGRTELFVAGPSGIAIWAQSGAQLQSVVSVANGQRIGNWLINTQDNVYGPVGDFDGDGAVEIWVASPWGIGLFKLVRRQLTVLMMAPNGTRFGGWLLNTADNNFGPVGDFDGDGHAEMLVSSPWGIGIMKYSSGTLSVPMMAPNGTRFGGWLLNTADNAFGLAADFDGDRAVEIFVSSPWGVGILKYANSNFVVPMMAPNGTRFGGWLLNTADNSFGPVGDYDGDRAAEIMVSSPWGLGMLKMRRSTLIVPMMAPNGTRFGGWLLNTADNDFGMAADFDGDERAESLVTSPWGIGLLKLRSGTMTAPMMAPNGTRFGGWLLNTADNQAGTAADFDGDRAAELCVTSPWGIGILKQAGASMTSPTMAANGSVIGSWRLDSLADDVGHGD